MSPFPVSRVSRVLKDRTICEDHKLQKIEGIVDRWQEDLKERKVSKIFPKKKSKFSKNWVKTYKVGTIKFGLKIVMFIF